MSAPRPSPAGPPARDGLGLRTPTAVLGLTFLLSWGVMAVYFVMPGVSGLVDEVGNSHPPSSSRPTSRRSRSFCSCWSTAEAPASGGSCRDFFCGGLRRRGGRAGDLPRRHGAERLGLLAGLLQTRGAQRHPHGAVQRRAGPPAAAGAPPFPGEQSLPARRAALRHGPVRSRGGGVAWLRRDRMLSRDGAATEVIAPRAEANAVRA